MDPMRPCRLPVLLAACLLGASGFASAGGPALGVSVRVAPARAAPTELRALPLPREAIPLTAGAFGGSYRYAGSPTTAMRFFEAQLPRNGYRLVSAGSAHMVWESEQARLVLAFSDVLGAPGQARIVITLSRNSERGPA